jgi:secreted PhoX family phosphatase
MTSNGFSQFIGRRAVVGTGLAGLALPSTREAAASGTFAEVAHGVGERHAVAGDHDAQVVLRWGDPVLAAAPEWMPSTQTAGAQRLQFGTECDFTAFLPLPYGSGSSTHGLLCVNHEASDASLMFPGINSRVDPVVPRDIADIEMAAHGHSVVEVTLDNGRWVARSGGPLNRRITAGDVPIELAGPAAGHERLKTRDDPDGRTVIGTIGNCSGGVTPWGTVLIAEESIHQYFGGDPRGTTEERNHMALGVTTELYYGWYRHYGRFDVEKEPHELNRFGWLVEIDPYDPRAPIRKRTALGRFKREGAGTAIDRSGHLVVYSGDDEAFQFIYRIVSARPINTADRAANRDLLDDGVLSVARFNGDGTVDWIPLAYGRGGLTAENGFGSQADVLIECRRAAALLGATPMDRPEGVIANPRDGHIYVALTKNAKRTAAQVDSANPRTKNRAGHILELSPPRENGAAPDHAATQFRWRPFILAGDPSDAASGAQYHADISASGWFACPDNLACDPRGRLWITSDGAEDFGLGDGIWVIATDGDERALSRHVFRGPIGSELTGPSFTPDGTTLFASVQHPAEGSTFDAPSTRWPDFDNRLPPRSSVVAIRRTDGSAVG